ncbi:MAG: 1-deoxy-D-xylulose-5-phosphate synthase, partial [Paramuribaculum sp.]|nr:1-deoxy-D-xylulose-5-phosphate synthase [Paramuribaculum sp.]
MTTLKVPTDESVIKPDADKYPLLSAIDSPADLRKLPVSELGAVCADIRGFLIDNLSTNPGHFASSMGAVELTVALHYVFNTPYDRIVWDVGHQAYGHKLLTGRAGRFHTNRKLGGLSGFPNPDESEYDTFTAGHASNSISAALGMAAASALKHEKPARNVVAVIGDASISGGLAFEGLNNAANTNSNLLIILNDNDMSIDRNVGSLNSYLAHLTASKGYNSVRNRFGKLARKIGLVTDSGKGRIQRFNNSIKSLITKEQNIFEGLNIRYFGPFDGHDLPRIIKVLNDIKDIPGPRLLHLRTVKGKGYAPAENDPAPWHAPGCFDPESGERLGEEDNSHYPKFQKVFGTTITELAGKNDRIVGITAAMSSGTSLNIMQKALPERVFDVGISEGHAVTFAGGLAKEGMLPFVAIYSAFIQRAYDNIIHDVAVQGLPVTFCIDRAGLVGEDGVTHHGVLDLAYMRAIPGMTVAAPRDADTLRSLLYTAQLPDRKGAWSIRYPRGRGYCSDPDAPFTPIQIGKGVQIREGADINVLSLGALASEVSKAIDLAAQKGVSASHYDMIFL